MKLNFEIGPDGKVHPLGYQEKSLEVRLQERLTELGWKPFKPDSKKTSAPISTTKTSRYAPIPRPFFGVKSNSLHSVEKETQPGGLTVPVSMLFQTIPAPAAGVSFRPGRLSPHSPHPGRRPRLRRLPEYTLYCGAPAADSPGSAFSPQR